MLAVAAGPLIYFDSVAADSQQVAAEFSRLENSGNETAQDWLRLARDARDMDELEIARESLEKASAYGLSPIQSGIEKTRILVASNDPAGAMFDRALAIGEAAFGPDHPHVAIRVNNLGSVLNAEGDLAGALAINETAFGPDHPNMASAINNLGLVLKAEGDLAGARTAFERALAIGETAFGLDHPNVAIWVNNLGSVLDAEGDLAGARAAYERALAIFERALGNDHPSTVTVRGNLDSLNKR